MRITYLLQYDWHMTIKGEFLSICLNVLTAGEAPLIHEQVRGVELGLGNEKPSTSSWCCSTCFSIHCFLAVHGDALLCDGPGDGLSKSAMEKTITGSSFLLLTAKKIKTWKEKGETCRLCRPGSLWMLWSKLMWADRVGPPPTVLILNRINKPKRSQKSLPRWLSHHFDYKVSQSSPLIFIIYPAFG